MPSKHIARQALRHWPGLTGPIRILSDGHINDTYLVGERHILQRINRFVFPNPPALMRNLATALAYAGNRLLVAPVACADGRSFVVDEQGDYWRLFPRIESRSFAHLPDALLGAAGSAFGGLLTTFASFNGSLEPVIPGFHDLEHYLAHLDDAPKTRDATAELRQIDALRRAFQPSQERHVIHGDCKINNLLFHPHENTVLAIIDLDTLMFGDPAWDFGDLVRSAFAGSEEAVAAQAFSLDRFERLCRGFGAAFAIDDVGRYAAAPAYMSFMLAVRFLADHLRGDAYFKVAQRGDNLLRARSQLDLALRFHAASAALAHTIDAVQRDQSTLPASSR